MREKARNVPEAYRESEDKSRFWEDDPCDGVIPLPGFISDSVYYCRGREVPTLFTIWASLFALATAIKREAWLPWADERLYSNLYVILVGPAGIVKKNAALIQATRTLEGIEKLIENPQMKMRKQMQIFTGTSTGEALLEFFKEAKQERERFIRQVETRFGLEQHEKEAGYKATAEVSLALFEMATSIGKKSYQEGIIEKLLDLYDPRDSYPWKTVSRGTVRLPFTLLSLCALTTAQGFRQSIPPVATSDGFLSRCVVVHQPDTARCFEEPRVPANAPQMAELRRRLAFIAEWSAGEYHLSDEARDYYKPWYRKNHDALRADIRYAGIRSRIAQNVLRVALLIHLQRYESVREPAEITLEDLRSAERLIGRTWAESRPLIAGLLNDEVSDDFARIEDQLRRRGRTTRSVFMRSAHTNAADLDAALKQLMSEGKIVIELNGKTKYLVGMSGKEVYRWIGDEPDKEEGDEQEDRPEQSES